MKYPAFFAALVFAPVVGQFNTDGGRALVETPRVVARISTSQRATGTVRGEVYDSLTMSPVAQALVWLPGTSVSTQADEKGRYTLSDVPTGSQFIAFSSAGLDSLGLGTLGAKADVRADNITQLRLATPSFSRIWTALCGNNKALGPDSGVVWGTVRDASTETRLSGARTLFNWYDMRVGADKKLAMTEITRDVLTDSTGTYYGCGLPTDIELFSESEGAKSASGVVQYSIGNRRVLRVDLLVSTEMILQPTTKERTAAEFLAAYRLHGTSTVRGVVRDDKGRVQANATLVLASVDTSVTANDKGQYALVNLPAGTHVLETRQVGFAPRRIFVDLHPGTVTEVDVVLSSTTKLATVNVRADRVEGSDRADFEARRRAGFGYALEQKDIRDRADVAAVLQGVPNVTVSRARGQAIVTMPLMSMSGPGKCSPLIWLDGKRSDMSEVGLVRVDEIRAVEIFTRAGSAPPQYVGLQACGVILFWTTMSKW